MAGVRKAFRIIAFLALMLLIFAGGWAIGRMGMMSTIPVASLSDRERQFSERMRAHRSSDISPWPGAPGASRKKIATTSRA